jgi:hypothetical protein
MQGFVGYSSTHKAIVVAFRGSANIPNWIANIDFAKVNLTYKIGDLRQM